MSVNDTSTIPVWKKGLFPLICLVVFLLAMISFFSFLAPWNDTIPGSVENRTFARTQWLDALAFEQILDASLERFGEIQYQSVYIGGGQLIVGDLRDGTTNPITWLTIFLSPLTRLKMKILAALMAGFIAVILLARKKFHLGYSGSLLCGVALLWILRAWPSMTEYPLDAGALFALVAIVIIWTHGGRMFPVGLAGIFITLACLQTGAGMISVCIAVFIAGLALQLSQETTHPKFPLRDACLALVFATVFGAFKWIPVSEAVPGLQAFWANPTQPVLHPYPAYFVGMGISAGLLVVIATVFGIAFFMVTGKSGRGGAVAIAFFGLCCLLPDWGSASGGYLGESELFGPLDSPARYFYPFFAFFIAASLAGAMAWYKGLASKSRQHLAFTIVPFLPVIALGAGPIGQGDWTPPSAPVSMAGYLGSDENYDFLQVRSHRGVDFSKRDEYWHPAIASQVKVGVTDAPMLVRKGYNTVPRFILQDHPPKVRTCRSYRGEYHTRTRGMKVEHVSEWANEILLKVHTEKPGTVMINRNFSKDWIQNVGDLIPHRGLLTVRLAQPGDYEIHLRHVPFGFWLGVIVSLISLIFFGLFCILECRDLPST